MSGSERGRSVDRLVAFTDAVVAIAITLLVLPLADLFSQSTGARGTSAQLLAVLREHGGLIVAFLLSFVLIARLWWAHHRLFGPVRSWTLPLVGLDLLWTLTIVVIPVTTAMVSGYEAWPVAFGVYCGVLLLSSATLTGMAALVHLSDAITTTHGRETRDRLIGSGVTLVAFAVAFVLGLAIEQVNFWALLLVALTDPFERLLKRHWARLDPALDAP